MADKRYISENIKLRIKQLISENKLDEALSAIPGEDKGFEEMHDLGDNHRVYVQIKHHGEGHHKVTALYFPPGSEKGTVSRKHAQDVPSDVKAKAVHRVFGSVKNFMKTKQWNSITLGGSDAKNKALYRAVGRALADKSKGEFEAQHLTGAGVKLQRKQKIEQPKSSGTVEKPKNDELESYRNQVGSGYGSSSRSRSIDDFSGPSGPSGPSGSLGPSGPYKIGDTLGASSEAKVSKAESSALKENFEQFIKQFLRKKIIGDRNKT